MTDYDKKIAVLEAELEPLLSQREGLTDKIVKLNKRIENLRSKKEKEQMELPMTKEQEIEYFLFEDGRVSGERYKKRDKFWRDKGLKNSGYFANINQVKLEIMVYKGEGDNLEQTITSLEEALPLIKEQDGVKHIGIFEHTLSEGGCWDIEITDSSFDLTLHYFHRRTVEKSFDNLCSLVEYVQEHHYYESSLDQEEDGEDY